MTDCISIRSLTKRYGEKLAVDGLSLDISAGELFALLGVNGAGKTTAIKMLSGTLTPDGGDALILGRSIVTELQEVKRVINVSPQETAVAPNLTVFENLELMAGIYALPDPEVAARGMMESLSMTDLSKQRAKTLSGGWQRRLSIAMALISKPRVLFLDEPTLGLDVIARRELWQVIEKLKGEVTVILTTHYMEEAEVLADRIGIMSAGRLRAVGTASELKQRAGVDSFEEAFVKIATAGERQL